MTQALSAAAIAAAVAACWLLGRPRPKIMRSTDTSAVAALNRSRMALVLPRENDPSEPGDAGPANTEAIPLPAAADRRGRRQLISQLEQLFQAGGEQRRRALAVCAAWRHRDTLPLLRRGLRDSDCQVAAMAAEAMVQFRGRSAAPAAAMAAQAKPPGNVSRTR